MTKEQWQTQREKVWREAYNSAVRCPGFRGSCATFADEALAHYEKRFKPEYFDDEAMLMLRKATEETKRILGTN